jgi:hypothetical protein
VLSQSSHPEELLWGCVSVTTGIFILCITQVRVLKSEATTVLISEREFFGRRDIWEGSQLETKSRFDVNGEIF